MRRVMKKFASVAAYLQAVPPAPRAALQKLRRTIRAAAPEATSYETSKGTIRFTPDKPLSAALVRKLVRARVAQNEAKR